MREKTYAMFLDAAARFSGGRRPMPKSVERSQPPLTRSILYNDSFYFNFFDIEKDIGGFTWIGKLHNLKMVTSVQVVFGPEKDALVMFGVDPYPEHTNAQECGGIRYEVIEPLKKWRIITSGKMMRVTGLDQTCDPEGFFAVDAKGDFVETSLELEFDALGPVNNSKDYCSDFLARQMIEKGFGLRDFAGVRKVAANHYEQSGICKGEIIIGGEKISIDATGHRDHSWGIRDWHAPKSWIWLSVQFGTEVALNLCRIVIGNIDLYMGHIFREGRNYALRNCTLETEFEPDGQAPKSISFFMEDTGGFTMNVTGLPKKKVCLVRDDGEHRVIVNEALTEYCWQGRKANGVSEYLHKIR